MRNGQRGQASALTAMLVASVLGTVTFGAEMPFGPSEERLVPSLVESRFSQQEPIAVSVNVARNGYANEGAVAIGRARAWQECLTLCASDSACIPAGCLGDEHLHEPPPRCRLSEFNSYQTFSYLGDLSATFIEFEAVTKFDLGGLEVENRTVANVADLPGAIKLGPTNPSPAPFGAGGGGGASAGVRAQGFGDILSGTFFSPKGGPENCHLSFGAVLTFPSATDDILGSGKWTAGPGAHFSAEVGRLTFGFFVWQSWSYAGGDSRSRVNQLFGKPFLIYEMSEDWNLVYIPLGMSANWDKPRDDRFTVPLGGGLRRLCDVGGHRVGLQAQVFKYVTRKPEDPEWEMRFTVELLFDE